MLKCLSHINLTKPIYIFKHYLYYYFFFLQFTLPFLQGASLISATRTYIYIFRRILEHILSQRIKVFLVRPVHHGGYGHRRVLSRWTHGTISRPCLFLFVSHVVVIIEDIVCMVVSNV